MAVPVRAELIARIDGLARRSLSCWMRGQDHRRTELRAAARALPSADALLGVPRQRLDACADRLPRALRANAQVHHTAFSRIAARLMPQLLRGAVERRRARFAAAAGLLAASLRHNAEAQRTRIARARERLDALIERARRAVIASLDRRADRVERAGGLLGALSYHGVLARGFALVRGPEGQPLRTAAAVAPGMRLDIEFQDGHIGARAETGATGQREPVATQRPKPRRRSPGGEGQGSLF
jgi:exodeoxyribonuclease VII large subunit